MVYSNFELLFKFPWIIRKQYCFTSCLAQWILTKHYLSLLKSICSSLNCILFFLFIDGIMLRLFLWIEVINERFHSCSMASPFCILLKIFFIFHISIASFANIQVHVLCGFLALSSFFITDCSSSIITSSGLFLPVFL